MNRSITRLFAAATVFALLTVGCTPSTSQDSSVTPEITVILESSTASLNPYSPELAQRRLGHLVFRGLLSVGPDMMPVPDLCREVPTTANGGISADGTIVTYRLGDATFHDGTTITARDVVFTIEQLRSGKLVDEPGINMGTVLQVDALDESTVQVRLSRPDAGLAWRLAPFVLPAHLLEDSPDLASDPYWLNPVGSGSYRITDVIPAASVRLRAVEGTKGPASLDVAFVPNQSSARRIYDDAPYAVWPDAEVDPAGTGESLVETQSAVWWRLGAVPAAGSLAERPEVRAVVRFIVERQLTASTEGTSAVGPFGLGIVLGSSLETTGQAIALLDSAGWRDAGEGVRELAGRPLEVLLRLPAPADPATADAIKAGALSMGMLLEVRPSGADYYGSFNEGGVLARADGDFFVTAVAVGAPPGYAWPYRTDDVPAFENPSGLNWQRLTDERATGTAGVTAAGTPAEAVSALRDAWSALDAADELVWLYAETERVLTKHVGGASAHPVAEEALVGCAGWSIRE